MASTAAGPDRQVPLRVHLVLVAVQLSFGVFHPVAKAVLAHLPPLALAGLRLALATPILLALAWRHDRTVPGRRDLPRLALLGLLGVFFNQMLFLVGLSYTTATNAALLMNSTPVFALALGALLGVERVGPRRILGIGLAVAGALVVLDPTRFGAEETTLGNLLLLTNCLAYAGFLVAQIPLLDRLAWRTVIAWSFLLGGPGVVAVATPSLLRLDWAAVPAGAWWGLAYIVLFPTVFGYAMSTWAMRRSSPSLVAGYNTLQPVCASLLAAAFLGEELGWRQAVGFALIAGGLWRIGTAMARPRQ